MEKSAHEYFAKIMGVEASVLSQLDKVMSEKTGQTGVFEKMREANEAHINETLAGLPEADRNSEGVRAFLRDLVAKHEVQLKAHIEKQPGANQFERAAFAARSIVGEQMGFFLKKEYASQILHKRPPQNLLDHFGYKTVDELLEKHDIAEAFSALRFMETDEWMHQTFADAYSTFTGADFEERPIELRVLGPEWQEVAEKFVAKKHHNVSHLKEFGVIFINPVQGSAQGKLMRDFALLFHYLREVKFYADLFKHHKDASNFAEIFKSLLRGDIKEDYQPIPGEWLIVQRYLFKEDPNHPLLSVPRVNPESRHWRKGQDDLANFGLAKDEIDLEFWADRDWVANYFGDDTLVSFDIEDNAMNLVEHNEGKEGKLTYHQREAIWNKIFSEYVGGREKLTQIIFDKFLDGVIKF